MVAGCVLVGAFSGSVVMVWRQVSRGFNVGLAPFIEYVCSIAVKSMVQGVGGSCKEEVSVGDEDALPPCPSLVSRFRGNDGGEGG